jgi:hypothetical protein
VDHCVDKNKAGENIRIIAYKPEDRLHAVGLMDWYLFADQKTEWDNRNIASLTRILYSKPDPDLSPEEWLYPIGSFPP